MSLSERRVIQNRLDSLSWYFQAGNVKPEPRHCNHPGHKVFGFINPAIELSEEAKDYTGEKKQNYLQLVILRETAEKFYNLKEYDSAIHYWTAALEVAAKKNFFFEELHMVLPSMNNVFFLQGDHSAAMKISTEGLRRAEKITDRDRIGHFCNVIGYIHMRHKNFTDAEKYFKQYLFQVTYVNDTLLQAHALINLSDLFIARRQYDSAVALLQQSLKIYRAFGVPANRMKFSLYEREFFIDNKLASISLQKADCPAALQQNRKSLESIELAVGINEYDKADYLLTAGKIYNCLQQPDSAIRFLRKGLEIARFINHREHTRDVLEQLSVSFSQLRKFDSAWHYSSFYSALRDSISNENNQQEVYQREAILQIEAQKQQYAIAMERQRTSRNIILIIAASLFVILFLLYNSYRLKQKSRMQEAMNNRQQEILNTTLQVQDRERKRIAEDLHDSLGSILSAAKLKLSALSENSDAAYDKSKLEESMSLVDEAISEMKNIAYDIMPATLSRLGLIAALQNLFNRVGNRAGLQVDFFTHGFSERLNEKPELNIYRIVLECVNNVVKHAAAKKLTVQLVKYSDYINITVEDDGKGFEINDHSYTGNGLSNIISRVKNLDGTVEIDSRPGNGTTVFADIPYYDK